MSNYEEEEAAHAYEERQQKKMENQPEEDHRDESYVLYSPCKFIEQLIKAFLKCLCGHVDDSSSACPKSDQQEDLDNPPPADNNETQMKSAEDAEFKVQGIRLTGRSRRRPSPPISTGPPGGQINVVSPS